MIVTELIRENLKKINDNLEDIKKYINDLKIRQV